MKKALVVVLSAVIAVPLLTPLLSEAGGPRGHAGASVGVGARVHTGVTVGVGVRHGYYNRGYYGYRYPGYWGARYWGPRYWGPRYWRPGVWVGSGFWWGWPYYGYPHYASPPVVIQQPPVYLEPNSPPQEPQYWYYCQNPQGYYPYVQKCPDGWMKVVPPESPPGE